MPRPVKVQQIVKVLQANGFVLVSQKGSHAKFRSSEGHKRTVIVKTTKKEVPHGTFQAILLQSGLNEKDFRE